MSLFVGNISKNVKKSDLTDEFDKFGKCDINHKVQYSSIPLSVSAPPPRWALPSSALAASSDDPAPPRSQSRSSCPSPLQPAPRLRLPLRTLPFLLHYIWL